MHALARALQFNAEWQFRPSKGKIVATHTEPTGLNPMTESKISSLAFMPVGCAAAPDLNWLWIFRVLQGVSAGAGTVVGRAIIRDLHAGPLAARLLSLVSMIFSLSPAVAPVLGGWIVTNFQWRAIFVFLLRVERRRSHANEMRGYTA